MLLPSAHPQQCHALHNGQLPEPGACGLGAGGHGELRGGERDHSLGSDPATLMHLVPVALGRQWPSPPFDRWETFPWGALRGSASWRPKARMLSYAPSQAPVAKDSPNPKGRDGMDSKGPCGHVGSDHTQP